MIIIEVMYVYALLSESHPICVDLHAINKRTLVFWETCEGDWVLLKMSGACTAWGRSWTSVCSFRNKEGCPSVQTSNSGRISQAKCIDAHFVLDVEDSWALRVKSGASDHVFWWPKNSGSQKCPSSEGLWKQDWAPSSVDPVGSWMLHF